jgi:replication initiation protein RepC
MPHDIAPTPQAAPGGQPLLLSAERDPHFLLDRWQVLCTVKAVARALGLGEREITVLSAHLSVLAKGPVRSDAVLVSYAGLPALLERANCMDERRFRRGEARLEACGLIRRKLSANARRFPVRDGKGRVVDAYGIDLRPLFEYHRALLALQAERAAQEAALRALKTRISAGLSALRRLLERRLGALPEDLAELAVSVRNALRRSRASLVELRGLERLVMDHLAEAEAAEPTAQPDIPPADAGQFDRHSEHQEKETYSAPEPTEASDPAALWARLPRIAEYHSTPPRDPRDLARRLFDFGGFLGLTPATRERITARLGLAGSAWLLDDLAGKILRIACPERYVLALLNRGALPVADAAPRAYDRGHIFAARAL